MTLEELYKKGTDKLKNAGVENPSVDAFYLLEHAAGLNRTKYLMFRDQPVSGQNVKQYMDILEHRAQRIPYQYITGYAEFAGMTFEVNPNVLIPRLDTEVLFEHVLRKLGYKAYVLDLCTGSGALGVALKRYRPDIRMVMSDISEKALEVAEKNAVHNHLEMAAKVSDDDGQLHGQISDPDNVICGYDLGFGVRLIKSDLFENMDPKTCADDGLMHGEKEMVGRFDVIVSNPPYVTEEEYSTLMPEVKDHEPRLALVGGEDGLDIYRRIAKNAPEYLKEGGILALEIGCGQAQAVSQLLADNGFQDIEVVKDLAGLDRVISCRRG